MNELVDIVIPVYNTGSYLIDCLESFKNQTFKDFKIFIVYDNSDDNSLEILLKYQEIFGNEHFEILYSPKKDGLGAARDFALDSGKLKGKYITFPDSDDFVDSQYLELLVQKAEETDSDVTYCGFTRFNDATKKPIAVDMVNNHPEVIENIPQQNQFIFFNIAVWNKLYKIELFKNLRFTNIKRAEDLFFMLKLLPSLKRISFVNTSLYLYRVRLDSLSNSFTVKHLQMIIDGFKSTSEFYKNITDVDLLNMYEAIGFMRLAIGATYRCRNSNRKQKKEIMQMSYSAMSELFPNYYTNPLLSLKSLKKFGYKTRLIWMAKRMYKHKNFGLFMFLYNSYNKLFKKDIKW